jgi:hypothetical protein
VNPDPFTAPWSRDPRLQSIDLVYRLVGSHGWTVAVNQDTSNVSFSFGIAAVSVWHCSCSLPFQGQSETGLSSTSWTVSDTFAQGNYEIAVRTVCTPSVSNPVPGS